MPHLHFLSVVGGALFLTALTGLGQTEIPKDVNGWSKAKWGMTEEQILQAFGGEVVREPSAKDDSFFAPIAIPTTKIGQFQFTVRFRLDPGTHQLCEVALLPVEQMYNYTGSRVNATPEVVFDELKELLTQKYGKPASTGPVYSGTVKVDDDSAIWRFPSAKIELTYIRPLTLGNLIALDYVKNENTEL